MKFSKRSLVAIMALGSTLCIQAQDLGNQMKVTEYKLANGLTVMLSENHDAPKVFGMVAVKAGGKNDPHDATGIAHYLEHVLFKGTQEMGTINFDKEKPYLDSINYLYEQLGATEIVAQRDSIQLSINRVSQKASEYAIANEMDDILKAMGATGVNAFTSEDYTAYINTFPSNQMGKWLEVYSHRFEKPVFRLFQSELETVYEEKNISMDGGFGKLLEEYNSQMYKVHPYGTQTILGSIEHLKNPSIKKMYAFYDTYYVANNMILALSGDFDTETIKPMIEEKFGKWRTGDVPKFPDYEEEAFQGKTTIEVKMSPIKVGILGFRTPKNGSEDAFTFGITELFLSNYEGTGYLDKLSEEGKLMESISMTMNYNDYSSTMIVYIPKVVGQSFDEARELTLAQIDKLKKGEFSDAYFNAILLNKKKDIALEEESNQSRAMNMVSAFMEGQTFEDFHKKYEALNTLTREDIIRVANKYYGANYLCLESKMGFPKKEKIEKPNFEPVAPKNEGPSVFAKELEEIPTTKVTPRYVNFEKDIQKMDAFNGMKVFAVKNPFNDVFDLEIRYNVGKNTYPNLQYVAHYLSMAGTKDKSSTELKEDFHQFGASYYFSASNNHFSMHIEGLDENLPEIMRLTQDFLLNVQADETKMKSFKGDLEGEKKIDRDEPSYISSSLHAHILLGENADLQRELTKKEMKKLSGAELVDLFKNVIKYEGSINYTGSIPVKEIASLSHKHLVTTEELTPGVPYSIREKKTFNQTKIYIINRKKSVQSQIRFHIAGSARKNSNMPQINAFNNYFGGGMSGLVFQEIREFRSLAYSAYGYYQTPKMEGLPSNFAGFIGCQSDKTNDAIAIMDSLINFMPEKPERMEGITSALMEKAQSSKPNFRYLINAYKYWDLAGYNDDPNKLNAEMYPEIHFEDIVNFQHREIKGKPMVITIVGDASMFDLDRLKQLGEVILIKEKDLYIN